MTNLAKDARDKAQELWPGTSVHSRGRGWIKHRHPTDENKFVLDAHIGPIHYGAGDDQEIDTAWQVSGGLWDYESVTNDFRCYVRDSVPVSYRYEDVATGHFVELTWTAVEWVNDEGDSENAASFSQVTPTIDDDRLTWPAIATGWDVSINAQTARLAKLVNIDALANLGAPTIGGTNPALQFRLTFQKSSGLEVWADGVQWPEKNNTWLEAADNLEFRDEDTQTPVFWFNKPWASDESIDVDAPIVTQRVKRTGVNLYAEIDIPWSWLQNAVYPIQIDPTVDYQVGASADDAYENNGTMSITGVTAGLNGQNAYNGGFRWTGVTIDSGATIDVMTAEFFFYNAGVDDVDCTFYGEDTSAPGTFTTTTNDISDRTTTTAGILITEAAGTGWWSTSSDLKTIGQELVDSYDYSSGLALAIVTYRNSTANAYVRTYDQDTANAAKLHIEFTAGAAGGDSNAALTGQFRKRAFHPLLIR